MYICIFFLNQSRHKIENKNCLKKKNNKLLFSKKCGETIDCRLCVLLSCGSSCLIDMRLPDDGGRTGEVGMAIGVAAVAAVAAVAVGVVFKA